MRDQLYRKLALSVNAYQTTNSSEWKAKHKEAIEKLVKEYMPSGAGFDSGTQLDIDLSDADLLYFTTSFHHMNDHGSYTGWTGHVVKVTPSLAFGFVLKITGRDKNGIKDYITDTFESALHNVVD